MRDGFLMYHLNAGYQQSNTMQYFWKKVYFVRAYFILFREYKFKRKESPSVESISKDQNKKCCFVLLFLFPGISNVRISFAFELF